ncbi:MAG TPA: LysE family transporter [Candidatus Competibacteraceae bacterium]|nr:LysE family transporter [Candidatus Competibacteraceae bacterium]
MLLKGLLIGFTIAAPVGPIGLLCIQRTLQRGRIAGFISGLGAASADAVYGSIAGFGLASLSGLLLDWRQELRWLGGLFLLYLGWRLFSSLPTEQSPSPRSTDLLGDYASTFLLTLTNPVTILAFIGIFTGLGLAAEERNFSAAGLLVLGVFLGSLLWWLLLGLAVGALRRRLPPDIRRWLNRAAGTVIALFGALALLG